MIKLKDILNEDAVASFTKELNGERIKAKVYTATGDGKTVEAQFTNKKWEDGVPVTKKIGVTFGKDGNHKYYSYSWYDKKYTGSATTNNSKPFKFKGNPVEWKDFTNDHLLQFWKKVKGEIKKNEAGAKAALDKEAKAQSDYYGSKSDTGRIGYGLSSQPRRGR